MLRVVLRRFAGLAITLPLTLVVVFMLTSVIPGDVARRILGREATQEAVDAKRAALGLDRPLLQQFWSWASGFVRGDWGTSYTKDEPVRGLVLEHLGRSLVLGGVAFAILVPLSVGLGLIAGFRQGTRTDRVITVGGLIGTSTPEFVSGVVLLILFTVQVQWLPVSARPEHGAAGLVLPTACLLIATTGYVSRMIRASVVATLEQPYVRTARLKGLTTGELVRQHVLRNSLLVPITALGVQLRYVVGGLVTVEVLFNYGGIGSLLLEAARDKDVPTLQAATLVAGVFVMVTFLITDLLYMWIDPRVRIGQQQR
jgi:peptide/nickel transport system permease protein